MTRLVLASASQGRLRVLRGAGVVPSVLVSGVDEDAVVAGLPAGTAAVDVVGALAAAKAEAVSAALLDADTDGVVLGCDSMLLHGGALYGKPGTVEEARRRWQALAGSTGELLTGHCLLRLRDGAVVARVSRTVATGVAFATPSDGELDAYLRSGEPLGVAGAFTLDGLGGWFVRAVDGDPSNVVGLSLPTVRTLLADLGVTVTDLWASGGP